MAKDVALDESASVTGRTSSGPITVQPFRYTELASPNGAAPNGAPSTASTRGEVTKAPSTRKGSKATEPKAIDNPPTMVMKRPRVTTTSSSSGWATRTVDAFVSWNLPLLGSKPVAVQLQALMTLLGLCAVVLVGVVLLNLRAGQVQTATTEKFGQVLMHTQRLAKAAPLALQGQPAALGQLKDSRDQAGIRLAELNDAAPSSVAAEFAAIAQQWKAAETEASRIAAAEKSLLAFGGFYQAISNAAPTLTQLTEEVVALKAPAGGREAVLAGQLAASAQRLVAGVLALGQGPADGSRYAAGVARDLPTLREQTQQLLASTADGEARTKLQQIARINADLQTMFDPALAAFPIVAQLSSAKKSLLDSAEPLQTELQRVRQHFDAEAGRSTGSQIVAGIAAVLCIALVLAMVQAPLRDSRRRAAEAEAQRAEAQRLEQQAKRANEQNQAAILRLMNELQEVADGNLTVQATVTEDITGAIADSVNYTVEELRGLVARINGAAAQVDTSSTAARDIASRLLTASEAQSRDIKETGSQVLQMTQKIGEVSRNAGESSKVARVSLEAAERGQRAVYNQIAGMNEIREQIQETAKRIKRLGESSQEIGEIGELISDITEQTNVLALNAAIQAASAGEAGRGFTVVAEEVQRLADRSAEATKQIGALVRAIQTDTQDAVAAMEKSTAGVVEGTKLSDAAGTALADIGRVSRQLADLIEKIAGSTKDQSEAADDVAGRIERILDVNAQTTSGTRDATQSIAELASLARELKESVARFRVS